MNNNKLEMVIVPIVIILFLAFMALLIITSIGHSLNVYIVNNSVDIQDRDDFLRGKFDNGISVKSLNTVKVDGREYLFVEFHQDTGIFEFSKDAKKEISELLDSMEVDYIIKE